jgi:hypothetical protein
MAKSVAFLMKAAASVAVSGTNRGTCKHRHKGGINSRLAEKPQHMSMSSYNGQEYVVLTTDCHAQVQCLHCMADVQGVRHGWPTAAGLHQVV